MEPKVKNPAYEGKAQRGAHETIRLLRRIPAPLMEGAVVLDLGCNEGLVSEWLMQHGRAARVVGYEPHPVAFERAQARGAEAGFTVRPAAVLSAPGTLPLRTTKADAAAGYFCNASLVHGERRGAYAYVDVPVVALRDVLEDVRPTGLKIDVEGSEWDMLLRTSLTPEVNWICLEIHWLKSVGGYLLPHLVRRMAEQGLGLAVWPMGRKLGLKGEPPAPYCFQQFAVMSFIRGALPPQEQIAHLLAIEQAGVRRHAAGPMTRIPDRQELMNLCYGRTS
jgi:FkbM family methyltransferase